MNQEGVIISLGQLGESRAATVHVWARFSCFFHILFTSRTLQNSLVESICSWKNQKRKKVRGKKREKKKKQAQRRKKAPFCQEEKKLVYESDWYWRSSSLANKEQRTKKSPSNQNLPCMMLKTRFSFVCKYQPWYKTLINDKRRINKFSNDILSTQRETWSNWKRIRDKRWVSFSIGTSQLKGTRMTQQWRIKKRELAIFLLTIEVQCLDGRFAFAWKKNSPAQKFLTKNSHSEKPLKKICMIQ